jgi:hypothetical protein
VVVALERLGLVEGIMAITVVAVCLEATAVTTLAVEADIWVVKHHAVMTVVTAALARTITTRH